MEKNLQEKLSEEMEYNIEKEHLQEILQVITKETIKAIDKRKEVLQYILDYRKKFIEEHRDDEDKVIEYFDHERYVKEEYFNAIDKYLKELTVLKPSPYFGKIVFREDDFGIETIYLGRFSVIDGEGQEPLIVDWRSPVAALFYNGEVGEAFYNSPMGRVEASILKKRQFIIKKEKLEGMFDCGLNIKDEILQMVLSKNSSDKLSDIIMTIQKEQDDIIREDRLKTLVVDGVAGSGKTTIALHRVAYLLYNYRKILEDKVLILGPNSIFVDYISEVLPSLGEEGVTQTTFYSLAVNCIGEIKEEPVLNIKEVMEKVLSGNEKLKTNIKYKSSEQYKNDLDEFMKKLEQEFFVFKDVSFRDCKILFKEEIEKMYNEFFKSMPLFRRVKKIKRIIISKLKDKRDEEFRAIEEEFKREREKYEPKELELEINNILFRRKLKIRELIEEFMEVKTTLNYLDIPDILKIYKEEFTQGETLNELDLGGILYIKAILDEYKLPKKYKHIVIDEAQDYSIVQFLAIQQITEGNSFTIVGDSNQRVLPLDGEVPLRTLYKYQKYFKVQEYSLNKSYRSTKEIMDYANMVIGNNILTPLVRSGEKVKAVDLSSYDEVPHIINSLLNEIRKHNYESIGIIAKDINECYIIKEQFKNINMEVKVVDNEEHISSIKGINIMPCYFAKGLEFDAAIVINSLNMNNRENKNLAYIMCTRALHFLSVLNIRM